MATESHIIEILQRVVTFVLNSPRVDGPTLQCGYFAVCYNNEPSVNICCIHNHDHVINVIDHAELFSLS